MKSFYLLCLLLLSLLLGACILPPIHPIDANPPEPDDARRFIEEELRRDWQARYRAYRAGRSISRRFLAPFEIEINASLPTSVTQAYAFYFAAVQQADWGNVYLLRPVVQERPFYMIYVTTDGDDGWIELYQLDGRLLGTARRYLELVSWGEQQTLRQQVGTGEFPAALRARFGETLWGK